MNIVNYCNVKRTGEVLKKSEFSTLFKTEDGRVAKIFDLDYLKRYKDCGFSIEEKILHGCEYVNNPGIIMPESAIYSDDEFIGYVVPYVDGKRFCDYTTALSGSNNLYDYACDFIKLENIIKSSDSLVFPDLLSIGNIMVCDNSFKLIDFDGFQIGQYFSNSLTSVYGDGSHFLNTKYHNKNYEVNMPDGVYYYTKNLDIRSLIYLYMSHVFGINLSFFDTQCKNLRDTWEYLGSIFDLLCIDDEDLINKICLLYFSSNDNCYLGDTMFNLACNYDLKSNSDNPKLKFLVRK